MALDKTINKWLKSQTTIGQAGKCSSHSRIFEYTYLSNTSSSARLPRPYPPPSRTVILVATSHLMIWLFIRFTIILFDHVGSFQLHCHCGYYRFLTERLSILNPSAASYWTLRPFSQYPWVFYFVHCSLLPYWVFVFHAWVPSVASVIYLKNKHETNMKNV